MIIKLKVQSKKLKSKKGFTILESLFAIFILSMVIAGVFTAVQQNLSQSIIAKDEVKAFYLAQEAIEVVRNIRDSNQLIKYNNNPNHFWLNGITTGTGSCGFDTYCIADSTTMSFTTTGCSESNFDWQCAPLLRQSESYQIGYNGSWQATNFRRVIKIKEISSGTDPVTGLPIPKEISVTVKIMWTKGLTTKEFTADTILFNWI